MFTLHSIGSIKGVQIALHPTEDTMRRNLTLSARHDKMLVALSDKLDISMVETVQRALELLEEKEAKRDKEVANG